MSDVHAWDHRPPRRTDPPAPALVEVRWRMKSTHTGKVLTCGLYRTAAPGIEVRVGYSADDVLATRLRENLELARAHADWWQERVRLKGGFEDLALSDGPA